MNLADFEKYDAALGKDEVDQIEKLMVEQINSMTGQRLESVKLYHMLPVAVHEIMLSKKGARVFQRESVKQILSMPFFRNFGSVLNSSQFRILSQRHMSHKRRKSIFD